MIYHITVYIPETHIETVKKALFDAGAGRIGEYDSCCWQVKGEGQFKPSQQANPTIGEQNQLAQVTEFKVELVCDRKVIKPVLLALLAEHPYEEPAYHVTEVFTLADFNSVK